VFEVYIKERITTVKHNKHKHKVVSDCCCPFLYQFLSVQRDPCTHFPQ